MAIKSTEYEQLEKDLHSVHTDKLIKMIVEQSKTDDSLFENLKTLTLTEDEALKTIKKQIAAIKRSKKYYDYYQCRELYEKLESVLNRIEQSIQDNKNGIELLVLFFSLDEYACNHCDDSDGGLGYIFLTRASGLFVQYAQDYADKAHLSDIIFELAGHNDYGCHDALPDIAGSILPREMVLALIERFKQTFPEKNYIQYQLAYSIKDGNLYEKLVLADRPNGLASADYVSIAECFWEDGNVEKSLEYARQIDSFHAYEQTQLLEKIYTKQGDTESLKELYRVSFMKHPSIEMKEKIISLAGSDCFQNIVAVRKNETLQAKYFKTEDVIFLLDFAAEKDVDTYILQLINTVTDTYFESSFMTQIKKRASLISQTVIFRKSVEMNLAKAKSVYYKYGISYLRHLDSIAPQISNWHGLPDHETYRQTLFEKHKFKRSFWGSYGTVL